MFSGAHSILFSSKPDELRDFLRDVLELDCVDAGHGWLVFALPPAELAIHPDDGPTRCELYLMCNDINATVARLKQKGVNMTQPVSTQRWGHVTAIPLPDGSQLGLYQPTHPTAHS